MSTNHSPQQLKRELGLFGSVLMGLGSVIGAGLFVTLSIATEVANSAVIISVIIAGLVGICNSLNSAQLSAQHAVSGEAYEYGYRYLNPWMGFTGGWLYLIAKMATAATAALGFAGYLLNILGLDHQGFSVPLAEFALLSLTLIVLGGIRSSKITNLIVVSITLSSLLFLMVAGAISLPENAVENLSILPTDSSKNWILNTLQGGALLFTAYSGSARIATMGEEVIDPKKNIPRAIILTIIITIFLYVGVALISIASIGAPAFGNAANSESAALELVAESFSIVGSPKIIAIGATTAMLSVLLNAILGLSRVILAMGRRKDMPELLAKINSSGTTPYVAVIFIGIALALFVLTGDVKVTWSFSAFAGLTRSAIINLAALKMEPETRIFPVILPWLGLLSSFCLAFLVDWYVWLIGLGLIGIGLIWHFIFQAKAQALIEN